MVANSEGIAGVHTGSIAEAFDKAVSQLKSESVVETDPVKCAIISASSEAGSHSTLASALNSLWNSVHIVREDGSAILLAENREGVGGGALQMFIEGRLKPEQLQASPYIDGLEHLLYIEELRQKYELGLVSTLPHYYARTKLGFATYAGMKDILDKLPDRHGKSLTNSEGIGAQRTASPSATTKSALRPCDSGVTSSRGVLSGALMLKKSTSNAIG